MLRMFLDDGCGVGVFNHIYNDGCGGGCGGGCCFGVAGECCNRWILRGCRF